MMGLQCDTMTPKQHVDTDEKNKRPLVSTSEGSAPCATLTLT